METGKGKRLYLYPAATTGVFGHFEFARVKSRLASLMDARSVPAGRKLGDTSAVYGPPTPLIQMPPERNSLSRAEARAGPAVMPWGGC